MWWPLIGIYLLGVVGFWAVADAAVRWFKLCLSLAWVVVVPAIGMVWLVEEVRTWLGGEDGEPATDVVSRGTRNRLGD